MKIGIGITSYKRPEHLELCLRQINKHTALSSHLIKMDDGTFRYTEGLIYNANSEFPFDKYKIYIAKDIPNIAKAKNECLYNLRDCDHIFLFDDDVFPVKDGWVDFFVNLSTDWDGIDHLLYLNERHNFFDEHCETTGCILYYRNCGGPFMYLTKDCFERVGYFNSEYKQYGFEHAGWSYRALDLNESKNNRVGMQWGYPMAAGTDQYLYSLDYQGEGDWGVKHRPSITDYKAMQESIDYNRKVFEKEISGDKVYYEYKP